MKSLLQKSGFFLMALILIKLAFVVFGGDKFVYPDTGTTTNKYEVEYHKNQFAQHDYNTVFIGSSRTEFAIGPAYFDSLTDQKTYSYNFGIIAATPPQTFEWCEELMNTKPSLKYVFLELGGGFVPRPGDDNQVLTFFKPSIPRQEFEGAYAKYNVPFQNIPLADYLARKDGPLGQNFSLEKVQQFRSLNLQIEQPNSTAIPNYNQDYWNGVSKLIELAESKQIRIYFFIPPRLLSENELKMVFPIYQKLDDKYKFKVAHFDESLYQPEVSFDITHLNHQGSKRFTELMAETFNNQNF